MKTTSTKTILIAGNQAGGQFKSTSIATLADALKSIGYSTKTIAIDHGGKPMLQKLCPDTVHISLSAGAEGAYHTAYDSTADIAIIDSSSCYAENLANPEIMGPLAEAGVRMVVGIILNIQSEHSLECGIEFAKAFEPLNPEYIVLAVHPSWPSPGWPSHYPGILDSLDGKWLTELAQGRVIEFPAFSQLMLRVHNDRPAVPSVHIAQAANPISAVPWQSYLAKVLESVSRQAEWLIQKKTHLPSPPASQKKPNWNPGEELGFMAEGCDFTEMIELIETYGVRGTEAPASRTGEIYVNELEQALERIPPHKFDTGIFLVQLLLSYNLSQRQINHALNRAVWRSQIRTVRLLLDHAANPNSEGRATHAYGPYKPLEYAAAEGDFDTIDALIAARADINLATKAFSLAAQNGRTKTLQTLIDMGFPYDLRSLGHDALISNNPSTIEAVRKLGVQYTAEDLDDEDVQNCPKSVAYLVSLGLSKPDVEEN